MASLKKFLVLSLMTACLAFAAGCTPKAQTEADIQLENTPAGAQTESLPPVQAQTFTSTTISTIAPAITASPTITPNPLQDAIEQISRFSTYDDFAGPFDPARWNIEEPDKDNPFSYSMTDGKFTVHMDPDQFGYFNLKICGF
jgi:hypothetical protein